MGHYIKALSGHNLNTSSMESLAKDLSDKLGISIAYGYIDDLWVDDVPVGTLDFITLGKIETGSKYLWKLRDWDYWDKITEPDKYADGVSYSLYFDEERYSTETFIYKYVIQSSADYCKNWWQFCDCFTGESEYSSAEFGFRINVYDEVTKLGGKAAIYFDDQDSSNSICEMLDFSTPTFEDIYNKQKEIYGEDFVNISDFLEKLEDTPAYKLSRVPLGFYDDFKMLRMGEE